MRHRPIRAAAPPETQKIMSIELLYIVPILALAVLVFLLVFNAQKRADSGAAAEPAAAGAPAGKRQGDTAFLAARRSTEERLNEYERTIAQINTSLSKQQRIIEKFQLENTSYNGEIEKLNSKLREIHKEYDIVISENYSLRAKVKSLQKKAEAAPPIAGTADAAAPSFAAQDRASGKEHVEMNMNLYEDTRLFKASILDDTSEFDVDDAG